MKHEIEINKNDEGRHYFDGWFNYKGVTYYVEGHSINTDEVDTGGEMHGVIVGNETTIELESVWSGEDTENEHTDPKLITELENYLS